MKKTIVSIVLSLTLVSCGGDSILDFLKGPLLNISDVSKIEINQLYINGGLEDDTKKEGGKFAVYLKDIRTSSQKLIACADEWEMEKANAAGIYYSNLHIPMGEVDADHPESSIKVQVIFVEKDSNEECPSLYNEKDDDVVGVSSELEFDQLFNNTIWSTNGRAAVLFKQMADETLPNINAMVPSISKELMVDKIYFKGDSENKNSYIIFLNKIVNGEVACYEILPQEYSSIIQYAEIVYSALGFTFSPPAGQGECIAPTDPDFENLQIKLSLMLETDETYETMAETEVMSIKDVIGGKTNFKDENGYITFAAYDGKAFDQPTNKIRLNELAALILDRFKHSANSSINATVELHFLSKDGDYSIACSGEDQGLKNIKSPGDYANLNAYFVAAEGQKELFGWDEVTLKFVERRDGLKCPRAFGNAPEILAKSDALTPVTLKEGKIFISSDGIAELKIK